MDGSLDQLMRLLSNRGLEWMRQRIMALPDPCPVDHPDLGALAMAGQVAPVLTGFRGRISPLEVIVQRRLTRDLVHQGAMRLLAGGARPDLLRLMLAGGLVARDDPAWQMACLTLAEDPTTPLPARLALSADPGLTALAEDLLTVIPPVVTRDHVTLVCQTLMQLFQHGAQRPRLSGARAFAAIFRHLTLLAEWAERMGCTASTARLAFCLRLLDGDHPLSDMMCDLIQTQRPDGSFPHRLTFGTTDQAFSDGVEPTLTVAMLLHMAAWKRWRGAAPVWLEPQPLRGALRLLAGRLAALSPDPALALHHATALARATGENRLARLGAPRMAGPEQIADLARICFRDPIAARHLRDWLALPRPPRSPGIAGAEAAWLGGAPVAIRGPLPDALAAIWDRAARRGDRAGFLACARLALHHDDAVPGPAIRAMTRRIAAEALALPDDAPALIRAVTDLAMLAQLIEPRSQALAAA